MKKINNDNFFLYKGNIFHKRYVGSSNEFKNKSIFLLVNLSELARNSNLDSQYTPFFFSLNKFNLISWKCDDHGNRKKNSSPQDLLKFINRLNKNEKYEAIYLFTFPRIIGFGFNPLSIYFCFNDKKLSRTIFEVKNTFGDIHHYILSNIRQNGSKQKVSKKLFVSPFFDRVGFYKLEANFFKNHIKIDIQYFLKKMLCLNATLSAKKINLNSLEIFKSFITLTTFPGKIWVNIHFQAFKLWLKKVNLYNVPKEQKVKNSKAKIID